MRCPQVPAGHLVPKRGPTVAVEVTTRDRVRATGMLSRPNLRMIHTTRVVSTRSSYLYTGSSLLRGLYSYSTRIASSTSTCPPSGALLESGVVNQHLSIESSQIQIQRSCRNSLLVVWSRQKVLHSPVDSPHECVPLIA
jgi:hypothetical protein